MKTVDQQDVHFHIVIMVIFLLGRGNKQQVDTQASSKRLWSFMGASWSLLGASHPGSQNEYFSKILQTFALLDDSRGARLQALVIHAP